MSLHRPAWYPDDRPSPFISNGQTGAAERTNYAEWYEHIPDLPALIAACKRMDLFCDKCGNVEQAEFGGRDRCLLCGHYGTRRTREALLAAGIPESQIG